MSVTYTGDFVDGDIESEPLVATVAAFPKRAQPPNPLPKLQLAAIFAVKIIIPISSTQVVPYLNVMCEKLAASEGANTGYYSGIMVRSE